MATILQMQQALIAAHNAGDAESARAIAKAIKERKARLGEEKPTDPTEGMSTLGKAVAGFGKAFVDFGRGAGQLVGAVSEDDVAESRRLDTPLMATGAGKVGNVAGNIAGLAPVALIPGVNTIAGAGVAGAGMGALQPTVRGESRLGNMAQGAALNAAFPISAFGAKAVKAGAIDPFRREGQEAIAGRVLERFAKDKNSVAAANPVGPQLLKTQPTLAEATGDEGIAQLQRVLMTQNPQVASRVAAREGANNAVRIEALEGIAGDASKREFFDAAREATAEKMYGDAIKAGINPKKWAQVKDRVGDLMQRPVMQEAQKEARRLAANRGIDITNKEGSVLGLHWMKKALDDMLDKSKTTGIGNVDKRSVMDVRDELIGILDKVSPKYAKARATYEAMSKPINQMDVGKRVLDKTTSALRDFQGNPKLYGERFAAALRDEGTAAKATGFKGATLENTMDPAQMAVLRQIEREMGAHSAAQSAGKVAGSPTAQYLVGQDLLRQSAGPLGLPKSWLESQFAQNFGARPTTWAYKVPEERIMALLGDAMLDPQAAASLLAKANKPGPVQQLLKQSPSARRALELAAAGAQVAPMGLLGSPAER